MLPAERLANWHIVYERLYYLPILFGAFWYGLRGGLTVAVLAAVLYLPHIKQHWGHEPLYQANQVAEIFLFLVIGVVAAAAPLTVRERASNEPAFPGWPSRWEGRPLRPLPLTEREVAFARGFPGRMGRLLMIKVPDHRAALEKIEEHYGLEPEEMEEVWAAWPAEAGDTFFHLVNTITRAANAPTLSLESRERLQALGGKLVELGAQGRWLA